MPLQTSNKKRLYVPSSFTMLFLIMLMFIIASWIGYAISNKINPLGVLDIFAVAWRGMINKAPVIIFIFAIGGTLGVMTKIKSIDAGIQALVIKLKGKEWLLIISLMFLFGLNGTTYGLWEETIVFFPVLIPIFVKAGYGAFMAVATILIGCGTGVLASTVNPFAVGTAIEAINDTEAFSSQYTIALGQGQRWIIFILFELIASGLVLFLAKHHLKLKGQIQGINQNLISQKFLSSNQYQFTNQRKVVLGLFTFGFLVMILGFLPWNAILGIGNNPGAWDKYMWWLSTTENTWERLGSWTFISGAGIFLIITLVIFVLTWKEFRVQNKVLESKINFSPLEAEAYSTVEETFINTYTDGIKDMVPVVLLIGLASGLGIILTQTNFGPLIAESIAWLASYNLIVWGLIIFLISLVLSFLIPSTSGFATAFMGIFAYSIVHGAKPENFDSALALTIVSFIFASGIINLWSPTSPALLAYLSYSKIPYIVWIKQTWLVQVIYLCVALVLIVLIGLSGNFNILF